MEWPNPSDMILEELRREWGTESDMLSEDIYGIGDWIRRFDTEYCASAQRMIEAWSKAVDLVIKSNHNRMTSLALIFTDDQVCPEAREQCQREIETYSRVFNNYGVVYKGNSVKARTQGVVEGPDRKAISSKINQYGPYYCTNVATTCRGPSEGANVLSANEDAPQGIWQDTHISQIIWKCQDLISNPPSDRY